MTRFALEKNRVTAVALAIVVVAGILAYFNLPQDEDPGFTIRVATVITNFPGASPERVEDLVTDKIEEVVQQIPELDFVASQSRTGISIVFVNIKESYDEMRPIWDDLRRKVEGVRGDLPEGISGPFVDDEFGDVFGILLALTGEGYSYKELSDIADEVRDELLLIEDAAKVEVHGAQDERVFVEYDNARLAELGLSAQQLEGILTSRNIVMPGGDVRVGDERLVLEPSGNFEDLDEVGQTVVRLPGRSDLVFLRDLATIRRGYVSPPETMVHVTGEQGLILAVSLREGGNILTLGREVEETIARLEQTYPWGVNLERIADQPARVERKVDEFVGNLLQAVGIVLLVMLITLGVRTGLVVATLIPSAMLMTLFVMQLAGIGLDQMSLAALIIALGMLIDNAIVMSESILVQMREGKSAFDAAVDSGRELRIPLLTSSLTTGAAFLPFYLAESTSGEYTGVIFVVVTITLLCSWVLALTMTPLFCVSFLKPARESRSDPYGSRGYRLYRGALLFGLRHRAVSLLSIAALFVGAMWAFGKLPVLFFPKADRNFFTATYELPIGTDIARTAEVIGEVESFLEEELAARDGGDGVTTWATFIGGGEPRYILNSNPEQANAAYAFMLINTTRYEAVNDAIEKLQDFADESFFDTVTAVNRSDLGPPVEKPIQVRLSGREPDALFEIAESLKGEMRSISGVRNVTDDWGRRTKKLIVDVNQPRARRAGVTSLDIAVSLQSLSTGVVTTEYREESDIIPVVLRQAGADRQDIGKLETLDVYSQSTGESVPLKQVADVRVDWEASRIKRRNRLKTITVECDLVPSITASEVNAVLVPWLEKESRRWPRGYGFELGGEIESSGEANASIGAKLPVAGLIIVLLLVWQFNSIRKPAIILATIPLGVIGVVAGLHLFRSYFGFMTLLGIVSLAGIVINNAIVLLDRIAIEHSDFGREPARAIVEAAQRRLRPILMTTMTTIGGLIPLYLGGGPMWEPMAVTIMCGLAFATMLTLGVVPALYSLFYGVSFKDYHHPA